MKNFISYLIGFINKNKTLTEEELSTFVIEDENNVFFVDYDGVVGYCEQYALDHINEEHGTNYSVNDIPRYGKTGNPIIDRKFELYGNPEFVKSQPVIPGAKEFITELQKRCKVVFLTAVNENCLTERSKAIQEQFGIEARDIILTSRKDLCVGKFLLDDYSENIRKSKCEYPILFRRPWNQEVSGAMSVTKYEDVLCFVDYILGQNKQRSLCANPILCFVGPTGSGKTEMVDALVNKGFKTLTPYRGTTGTEKTDIGKDEFIRLEENGFFAETSVYGGIKYGISNKDVAGIQYHDQVAVCIDIGGAMALKNIFGDRVYIIYCDTPKENAIAKIVSREDITMEEKILRLNGLESEYSNSRFCDYKLKNLQELLALV